jgi:PAS domain S-box-containing protein
VNIDIRTLAIVLGIISVLQVAAFFIQYVTNKTYRGMGWWLLWSASTALGFAFMLLRDVVSIELISFSIFLANALLLAGQIFLYTGIMRFLDKKEHRGMIISISAVFILSTFYVIYVNRDDNARALILYIAGAIFSFLAAHGLLVHKTRSITLSANILSVLFLVHGSYFVFRFLEAIRTVPVDMVFAPTPMQTATFLVPLVTSYLWAFCLIIMSNQRSNAEMREAKDHFELIFNTSPDAVTITRRSDGGFVGINDGFTVQAGFSRAEVIGKSILDIDIWKNSQDRDKILTALNENRSCDNLEVAFQRKDGSHIVGLLSAKTIFLNGLPHIISVVRDITERKKKDEALKNLISKLQKAIDEIKTLKGIVPICANCKNIRDDKGFWEQVEAYVSRHTEAQFSHSICPDCMEKLYPEMALGVNSNRTAFETATCPFRK